MPAKIMLAQTTIDAMCSLFKNGASIAELMSKYSLSRNKITKTLREALGEEYTAYAQKIISKCAAKSADKRRGRKNPHTLEWNAKIAESNRGKIRSEETKAKISKASRTRFERGTWSKEQHVEAMNKAVQTKRKNGYFKLHGKRHSEWMIQNAPMRNTHHTEKTRQKMRNSRKAFFDKGGQSAALGRKISSETRQKLSTHTKRMWAEGKFSYGGGKVKRSKLEKKIYEQVLIDFPDAQHSRWLTINDRTYVFDIFIPSINTLIEVNGNYWHLNPKLYESSHVDKYRNVTAEEIWKRDEQKRLIAKSLGYNVVTVWESEAHLFNPKIDM
jgi:G:T-mismatch repair DNA endonuclease (very short patch repair protein)